MAKKELKIEKLFANLYNFLNDNILIMKVSLKIAFCIKFMHICIS